MDPKSIRCALTNAAGQRCPRARPWPPTHTMGSVSARRCRTFAQTSCGGSWRSGVTVALVIAMPHLRSNLLWWQAFGGCLSCSPSRLSCRRIECALAALTVYGGREPPRSAALTAQSKPPAHARRRQRTLDAASARSTPPAHARRRQRTLDAASARSTPPAHARRRQRTLDAASARSTPSATDPTAPARDFHLPTPGRSPTTALSEEPRGATNLSLPGGQNETSRTRGD